MLDKKNADGVPFVVIQSLKKMSSRLDELAFSRTLMVKHIQSIDDEAKGITEDIEKLKGIINRWKAEEKAKASFVQ